MEANILKGLQKTISYHGKEQELKQSIFILQLFNQLIEITIPSWRKISEGLEM